MRALGSSRQGITGEEAARRLEEHGPNSLPEAPRRHPFLRFLAHFIDAAVIAAVVVVNAVIGVVQEGKAEAALEAMRRLISPKASVLRDGARRSVAVAELVPGDLVSGDPAAELARLARDTQCELLALGTRGRAPRTTRSSARWR